MPHLALLAYLKDKCIFCELDKNEKLGTLGTDKNWKKQETVS